MIQAVPFRLFRGGFHSAPLPIHPSKVGSSVRGAAVQFGAAVVAIRRTSTGESAACCAVFDIAGVGVGIAALGTIVSTTLRDTIIRANACRGTTAT